MAFWNDVDGGFGFGLVDGPDGEEVVFDEGCGVGELFGFLDDF